MKSPIDVVRSDGPVVMTERVDVFTVPGGTFDLTAIRIFELRDDKINAWRDYFDIKQFTDQIEQVSSNPNQTE